MSRSALAHELSPAVLVPAITAGLIAGVLAIILQISFAVLIFVGDLSPMLGRGIGLALFSGFVLALVVAVMSSFPVSIASPQDSPAAILGLLAISISALLSESRDTPATYATVISALAVTTMFTGAFFFGLGQFRLGRLVRFIPYPVIGGFLAGTGWLLLQGGVNVMTGAQLTPEWVYLLSQPTVIIRWLPGIFLACVLLIVLRRWTHGLVTPAIIFIAILLFYFAITMGGLSIEQARDRSWMLGPFPPGSLFQFLTPTAFLDANWTVVLRQADKIAAVILVSVVALLLNASGIELAARRDVDFNRELKAAGLANFIAGLGAGLPGYHLLGATTLSHRLGARSRMTGITAALLIGFTLLFGASLLEYFPRPVLGGLLAYFGISFLVEWLYDAWFKLPHLDYALIVVILVVIAVFGFLPGVGVGIVIAMLLFIVNYSRIRVVKHSLTGESFRSQVDRSPTERALLRDHGEQLLILQLQEFIFFGTGQGLLDQIRIRIQDTTRVPLRFIVMDFRRVPGLDSSAVASFLRMQQLTQAQQIELVLTDVRVEIQEQLARGGMSSGSESNIHYFESLDHGVEWCEDRILEEASTPGSAEPLTFHAQLAQVLPNANDTTRLDRYMRRIQVPAETTLLQQGEGAHALYFIESGEVSVELKLAEGKTVRLRTIHHGTVVGEVAMYLGGVRTASVVTLEPTIAYRLTSAAIAEMEQNDPDLAAALHKWIAGVMAERLADNVRTLEAVMD
jgi:SulP family sulfate permease